MLDNFEHLLEAAPLIAEVLAAAPGVKVCTTSRATLRLSGEFVIEVPPLSEPAAVELFTTRAVAVKPNFALTHENRDTVARICQRVDGLPLAIELAAARLRLFGPRALLARLTATEGMTSPAALDVLVGGPRDLPAHQRALRNTIAWSYNLLASEQQRLLRHLSVFAGGCSLEAAQAVVGNTVAFDADLQALLDSSLVHHLEGPDGEPRLSLLELIRAYATEQLAACGEADEARRRHATYFLGFVKGRAPEGMRRADSPRHVVFFFTGDGIAWVKQLESEYANLRTALAWGLGEVRDTDVGTELAVWLVWLWYTRLPWGEAVYWLERALAHAEPDARPRTRAVLLVTLAPFAGPVRHPARAVAAAQEALAIFRALGDTDEIVYTLHILTDAEMELNSLAEAQGYAEQWVALTHHSTFLYLLEIALWRKDFARAAELIEEMRRVDPGGPITLTHQGTLACCQRDYERAIVLCEEALAGMRALQWKNGIASVLHSLGDIALFRGDEGQARARFTQGLRLFSENGNRQRSVWCLGGLATLEASSRHAARAVTLWAAAEALHAAIGSPRPALRIEDYRQRVEEAMNQLEERAAMSATAAGRAMRFDQAVDYALQGGEADELPVR